MKYEFTGVTKIVFGVVLKQIVRKADKVIGGWIEKESNLFQEGNAWVYGDAQVSGDAWVFGDAWVYGGARVSGDARVSGNAWVFGDARVAGNARVSGNAWVYGDARVIKKETIINIIMFPYSITITPQNIVIGCTLKSRFGKDQWTSKGQDKDLVKIYSPILKVLKKQLSRQKANK